MTGLILNLRPWESFLVGGHVLQNGSKKAQLRVRDESVGVLRLSDALHPDEVRSPLTRAYYAAQLLLLGNAAPGVSPEALDSLLEQASSALGGSRPIETAQRFARGGRYYMVMRTLKPLLPEEALLLSSRRIASENNLKASVSMQS